MSEVAAPVPMEERVIVREHDDPDAYVFGLEASPRWVRVVCNGVTIADSKAVRLLHESKHMPVYYFPVEHVRMDLLTPNGQVRPQPHKGPETHLSLTVGDRTVPNAGWYYDEPEPEAAGLRGLVAFYWSRMDAWYEEDDEVYVHPRDPRHRVDVLHSSRHVQVIVLGETVAETTRPSLLFETDLPTRYYIPRMDVRPGVLVPSTLTSQCPYKGIAEYYSVRVGNTLAKDLAWYYRHPLPECPKIENLICFFNEQVDAILVDGEEAPKPKTAWSRPPTLISVD
jgi:uncharacterized protein (DUF427 family)